MRSTATSAPLSINTKDAPQKSYITDYKLYELLHWNMLLYPHDPIYKAMPYRYSVFCEKQGVKETPTVMIYPPNPVPAFKIEGKLEGKAGP